jgi:hypothetical protein
MTSRPASLPASRAPGAALALLSAVGVAPALTACAESTVAPVAPLPVAASYTFTVDSAEVVDAGGGFPFLPGGDSLTVGQALRVDLEATGGAGVRAAVTPRWGATATYSGRAEAGRIALTVAADDVAAVLRGRRDAWTGSASLERIVLEGDVEAGRVVLHGGATFEGSESYFAGDVGSYSRLRGTMVGEVDQIAPEARLRTGPARDGRLAPWQPVRLDVAEPVDLAMLTPRLDGPAFPLALPDRWTGTLDVRPAFGWWPERGGALTLGGGYADLVGNVGLPAPEPLPLARFVASVSTGGSPARPGVADPWGSVTRTVPSGLDCESPDGCLVIERADASPSCGRVGGFFGRLATPTDDRAGVRGLRLRLRAVVHTGSFGAIAPRELRLVVEAAPEGDGDARELAVALPVVFSDDPSAPPTEHAGDTGWVDVDVLFDDLRLAPVLGYVVDLERNPYCGALRSGGGGAPLPPAPPATVVLARVDPLS